MEAEGEVEGEQAELLSMCQHFQQLLYLRKAEQLCSFSSQTQIHQVWTANQGSSEVTVSISKHSFEQKLYNTKCIISEGFYISVFYHAAYWSAAFDSEQII